MNAVMNECQILVVRIPDKSPLDEKEFRDYIEESWPIGKVVIRESVTFEVMSFPKLGGVKVFGAPSEPGGFLLKHGLEQPEPSAQVDEPLPSTPSLSPEAAEKQRILARVKRFRAEFGPGCLETLGKRCGKGLGSETLRGLCLGEVTLPLPDWKRIDKALDRLHFETQEGATASG